MDNQTTNVFDALTFPLINKIDDLHSRVCHKEEMRFTERNGFTVACYMVSSAGTFDDKWSQECRGIVFGSTGEVVSRPLHKFFNVNEREATLVANIPWDRITRIMLKRDGSMIHTVRVGTHKSPFSTVFGKSDFDIKSKKSFESDVCNLARTYLKDKQHIIDLCDFVTKRNATAIFEFTSPNARIVVAYPEHELQLLHIRDNVTGTYYTKEMLAELCAEFGVPLVETHQCLLDELDQVEDKAGFFMNLHETVQDIEGWVFQLDNGQMYKLKTKWYMDRHHAMTFLRVRDVARMVIDESLDDLKAKLVGDGLDITEILGIETEVVRQLDEIIHDVTSAYEAHKHMDRKSLAMKLGPAGEKHKYFGMIMQLYAGNEPNYTEFFERNYLSDRFDLRQLTMVDSVAEAD